MRVSPIAMAYWKDKSACCTSSSVKPCPRDPSPDIVGRGLESLQPFGNQENQPINYSSISLTLLAATAAAAAAEKVKRAPEGGHPGCWCPVWQAHRSPRQGAQRGEKLVGIPFFLFLDVQPGMTLLPALDCISTSTAVQVDPAIQNWKHIG